MLSVVKTFQKSQNVKTCASGNRGNTGRKNCEVDNRVRLYKSSFKEKIVDGKSNFPLTSKGGGAISRTGVVANRGFHIFVNQQPPPWGQEPPSTRLCQVSLQGKATESHCCPCSRRKRFQRINSNRGRFWMVGESG